MDFLYYYYEDTIHYDTSKSGGIQNQCATRMPPEPGWKPLPKKLTDAYLKSLKPPPSGRIEIRDSVRCGLCFRLPPTGNASWIFQKKVKGGRRRGQKIGSYPDMSLSEARMHGLKIESEAIQGIDRVDEAAKAAEHAVSTRSMLVSDLVELYINTHIETELKEGNSKIERQRQLRKYLRPLFDEPVATLTRNTLQKIVDDKKASGKTVMANRLRAAFSAFSNWAFRRGYLQTPIGAGLERAGKERPRERTPALWELKEIWAQTFEMGALWGPYLRLCILTGQRCRSDILKMRWSWVDFAKQRYEIPNPKNGKPHIVPLSTRALEELETLRRKQTLLPPTGFVFTTNGTTSSSGVTKAKKRLDARVSAARRRAGKPDIEHWVLHDLRRSQATFLAEAGFEEGVVDRIQNHSATGSRPSIVAAVYNKAEKLTDRAKALQAWEDTLLCEKGNIIRLDSVS